MLAATLLPMQSLLAVNNLIVKRGNRAILNDVSFVMENNSFTAIVGANGAGKTTLLRSILGMYPAQSGSISLKGTPLSQLSPREKGRLLAYVPQQVESAFSYSVTEFCLMARHPHLSALSGYGTLDVEKVTDALRLTNIEHLASADMSTLSGGERQRVVIAAALTQEPQLLLLDEPTHFLDPKHSDDIILMLRRLHRDRGISILMVTHDINAAAALADSIVALRSGTIEFIGSGQQFIDSAVLARVYGTSFTFIAQPKTNLTLVLSAALAGESGLREE